MRSSLTTTLSGLSLLLGGLTQGYQVQTPPLDTDWTSTVAATAAAGGDPWPEHPRPLLQRSDWKSLNGLWKWREGSGSDEVSLNQVPLTDSLGYDVLVPSCIESALSGIMMQNMTYSWFSREFEVPEGWASNGKRLMLNFEAVDYQATVYINKRKVGQNIGGYWHFGFDITDYVQAGNNTLQVNVFDPTDAAGFKIPLGKQVLSPSHIFYTPCTGIWQTVWMESVPSKYITTLDVAADMHGMVNMTVGASKGSKDSFQVSVAHADGSIVAVRNGTVNQPFQFKVDSPDLWSPDSPTLYNLTVTYGSDRVSSYTGFRTIASEKIDGIMRPTVNGEFTFLFGTLDQGFWPDGIYTPPNREAMVYDLKYLKSLGANMLRKHIKVENALFYQACDQLGLLLIQDMPSMSVVGFPSPDQQTEWERQLELLIQQHKSNPSIFTWVIYNEGWSQLRDTYYPEEHLTQVVRQLDPTRLIDATSGWYDHGNGDYSDNHHYANPQCGTPYYSTNASPYDPNRIAIQGEFGGIGHNISAPNAWKVQASINAINETYELDHTIDDWNYRGHALMSELRDQVEMHACSAAIWTQTTDVEGEVNGFLTYDRRLQRPDAHQWKSDIQALKDAAESRNKKTKARSWKGKTERPRRRMSSVPDQ